MRHIFLATLLLMLGGCEQADPTGTSGAALTPTTPPQCEVEGTGQLANGDWFDGTALSLTSGTSGSWEHVGGALVMGEPTLVVCTINGVATASVLGPATLNGESGYTFQVTATDRNSRPTVASVTTQNLTATRYYSPTQWENASLSIDGTATVTIPEVLPVTVGGASNQWAWLTFTPVGSEDAVSCRYRGAGDHYVLARCVCKNDRTQVQAGDQVEVTSMTLHVHTGDHRLPTTDAAQTTVSVDIAITTTPEPLADTYSINIYDGENPVFAAQGPLVSGDISVRPID